MACEFLFDLLMLCYKRMSERKSLICQVIARQLSIQDNKEKSAEEIAAVMIHEQLQQQWGDYLKNEMKNSFF